MARGRIAGITIEIAGETTKLQNSLKKVDSSLRQTQSSLKDVNKLLKLDPSNTELLTQKQRNLKKAINETKERLQELREASKQVTPESVGQEKYDALQREIIETEQDLKSLEKQYKDFGSVSAQQIAAAGEKMKELGSKIEDVGKNLTTKVSAPIAALGAVAVKTTADFDTSMSKVAAVSGATGEDFDALRDKAREMGAKTQFSASEAADAMNYMAMAGWKTEDMLNGVEGIMNLAAASGEDLATTSDIVTDALTAFGMSAEDSGHFADVLAAASSNANTNVSMLGESFKYVAPVAGSLGYSAEDTSVALGLMANSGIKASQAGTSLRTLLTNMSNPTDQMATAMEELGISLTDSEGNMLSMREVMDNLRSGFSDLRGMTDEQRETLAALDQDLEDGCITQEQYEQSIDELVGSIDGATGAQKAQTASMLAGKTGMSGLLAIVNASDEDYQKLTDAIDNCDGAAQDMADVMNDNLNGQLKLLISALQELAISFGDILMPYIRKAVEFVQNLVDKFNSLDEGTKKIITVIALVAAAIGPVLLVVGKIMGVIGTLMTYAPMLSTALTVLTGPIGLVVAAVAAAIAIGVLLYKNWDKICEFAQKLANTVSEKFNEIKTKIFEAWDDVKTETLNAWNNVKTAVSEKIENVRSTIQTKVNAAKTAVQTAFENIKNSINDKITAAKNKVSTIVGNIRSLLSFSGLASKVSALFSSIKEKITSPINEAKKLVSSAVDKIKGLFPISLGKIFSGIKLPHFHISGGQIPWGIGGKGTAPSVSIEWYKKAMNRPYVLDGATIFGAMGGKLLGGGEAGKEVVLGYDAYKKMASGTSININMTVNAAKGMDETALANMVSRRITKQIRELNATW